MSLSQLLEAKFRADVRFRGEAYVHSHRVSITSVTPDRVVAVVHDGAEHQTHLKRHDSQLDMFCTCRSDQPAKATCKHVWATLLAAEQAGYVTAASQPNRVSPFRCGPNQDHRTHLQDEAAEALSADTLQRASAELPDAPRVLRDWEARVAEIEHRLGDRFEANSLQSLDGEIYYAIDRNQSAATGQLVIDVVHRQRRASGQWGKLKPLRLRMDDLNRVPDATDRMVLAYLLGATEASGQAAGSMRERRSVPRRFLAPHALAELILPTLCATGRLIYRALEPASVRSVAWDDGPPWELSVSVDYDRNSDTYLLTGWFERADERKSLDEIECVVPGGLLMTDSDIGLIQDFQVTEWMQILSDASAVQVPSSEIYEFLERFLGLPSLPRLTLDENLALTVVTPTPIPHLLLSTPRRISWRPEQLRGSLHFDYEGHWIQAQSGQGAVVDRAQRRLLARNRHAETQRWSQLESAGFRRIKDFRSTEHSVQISAREIGPAIQALLKQGWSVQADGQRVRPSGLVRLKVQSRIDWFELHGRVDFGGRHAEFPELLSALGRGDTAVKLDDGSLGLLPEQWQQQYSLLAELGIIEDTHLRFRRNQVGLLDVLLASEPEVDYDARFQEVRQRIRSFEGVKASDEPAGFLGQLRGYQREGLGWLEFLQEFKFGGCLADDMGLGKTVQLLALLQAHSRGRHEQTQTPEQKQHVKPSLVVVPKSLMFNWCRECARFTPDLKVLEYQGLDRESLRNTFDQYDIVLATYGTLRRDILDLKGIPFEYVVLDEAQTIKNPRSQIAKATRLLQAEHRLALSGTPIENHIGDLWSIFEFLNPGMLGRSSILKLSGDDADEPQTLALLRQGLQPFILRRTKSQVASDLPDKSEQTVYCDMDDEQRRLYEEMRDHYRDSLLGLVQREGIGRSTMHVLEALLRLRQAACHPGLLDRERQSESSAKLDVLLPYLDQLLEEQHKALIFSQFTSMLSIVKQHLDRMGIVYEYLDGSTRHREKVVTRFQTDPDCGVFLISLKAGGFGLNLTAADYVFLIDPWWNPAVESQAIDRSHRLGQQRQVFAYRLICRNTVEEKIEKLQQKKRDLADALLKEETGSLLKNLTTADIELLLS